MATASGAVAAGPTVGLFVTCLVDLYRPSVGHAAVRLLQDAGCELVIPLAQTCCGQPAFNAGDLPGARAVAAPLLQAFAEVEYVVAPSGSCAGMLRHHLPEAFDAAHPDHAAAQALAAKTHELTSFLVDVLGVAALADVPALDRTVTYHDSCSSLREMKVKAQPRQLLASVPGAAVRELADTDVCCGFGGTFCVKYPDISGAMVEDKAAAVRATGAEMLLAGDMGCLMNIAGRLRRNGSAIEVRHVAEVLAGLTDTPPIAGT